MMGGFARGKRADEFQALVARGGDATGVDAELAELLEVVGALRSVPPVEARPAFVAQLRSALVAEAEAMPKPERAATVDADVVRRLTPKRRRGSGERRIAAAIGGFAAVAATGSMAVASQASLPGDTLYPMKRAIENAQTNLQSSDAERAASLLAHAETRLEEVRALAARGNTSDADEISATLQDFSTQANQAASSAVDEFEASGDDAALQQVRNFAGASMGSLTDLGGSVPEESRPALINAAQTVKQVDSVAQRFCPTCAGELLTELPAIVTQSLEDSLLGELAEDKAAQLPPQTSPRDKGRRNHQGTQPGPGTDDQTEAPQSDDDDVLPEVPDPTDVLPEESGPLGELYDDLLGDKDGDNNDLGDVTDGVDDLLGGLLGGQ